MTRLYLRCAFWSLFTVSVVIIILARAQPYDDRSLRQILLPDDCAAPCFMGIRPGITTVNEALEILRSSGWVSAVQKQPNSNWIIVRWNQFAPSWLSNNELALATLNTGIAEIHLPTRLSLNRIELLMGRAESREISTFRGEGEGQFIPILNYTAAYPSRSMLAVISETCNGLVNITLNSPDVSLRYYANMSKLAVFLKNIVE